MDEACEEDSVCLSPLMMAVLQGDTPTLENLIGSGGDVNECDLCYVTPLVQAIQKNNLRTVQILLHAGACPNGNPEGRLTPLQATVEKGSLDMVDLLLNNGCNINGRNAMGATALHTAALHGDPYIIAYMIVRGAAVDVQCNTGQTPLMYASEGGSKEAVLSLVGAGADVNWECQTFGSPLHVAASRGNIIICEVLIRAGAQVNLQDWHSGATPLIHAAQRGRLAVLELLIAAGAQVQLSDKCGRTALHHASMLGWSQVVDLLLRATALTGIDTPDFSDNTALLLAVYRRRYSCVFKLVQYGADLNSRGRPSSDCTPTSAIELALTLNDRDLLGILSLWFADRRIVPWQHQHMLHPSGFSSCEQLCAAAPRKLKELCRVGIRIQLHQSSSMLMLEKLPLPHNLLAYLMLKDLEEEYSKVWPEDGPLSSASSQSSLLTPV